MIEFTSEDVVKIVASDTRFKSDNLSLKVSSEEEIANHMIGIRNCVLILSTLRTTKKPNPSCSAYGLKHIVECMTGRYTWSGEVLVAAHLLGIPDDGNPSPRFALHEGDLNRLRTARNVLRARIDRAFRA